MPSSVTNPNGTILFGDPNDEDPLYVSPANNYGLDNGVSTYSGGSGAANGGVGAGYGGSGGGGIFGTGGDFGWGDVGEIGLGGLIGYGLGGGFGGGNTLDPGRNLGGELAQIGGNISPFNQDVFNNYARLSPGYTDVNVGNFNNAVNGVAGNARDAWNAANPDLAGYTAGLGGTLTNVINNMPTGVGATGYNAVTATGSQAGSASQSAFGGPGYNPITAQQIGGPQDTSNVAATSIDPNTGFTSVRAQNGDVGLSTATNRMLNSAVPSNIQRTLEMQAQQGLGLGQSLSSQEVRDSQQAARAAWGARGLASSNGALAAEVLNRDQYGRQRENERRAFAQQVDATGFGQRQQGFTNALGVSSANQNYAGMGLAAQQSNLQAQLAGNQLKYQSQAANQAAQMAAQQANQQRDLALNNQRMQAAQANQDAALRAAQANQVSGLGYAQATNQNNQFNAGQQNQIGMFNANLAQQNDQYNAGQATNAEQANAAAINDMNRFNQNLALQGNQAAWNDSLAYGNFQAGQAINPFAFAGQAAGQTPDYTGQLLGYGQDVFNTTANAGYASNIAAANNQAATNAALLRLGGQLGGAYLGNPNNSGIFCWIAREVYGAENPKWLQFREWMLTKAPKWLLRGYVKFGPQIAECIKDKPRVKSVIRSWMDARIETTTA